MSTAAAKKIRPKNGYVVVYVPDGCDEEYVGDARTLHEARRLARRHERGESWSTPRSLYATAEAAGCDVPGCSAPPEHEDLPVEWAGKSGDYAVCRAVGQ